MVLVRALDFIAQVSLQQRSHSQIAKLISYLSRSWIRTDNFQFSDLPSPGSHSNPEVCTPVTLGFTKAPLDRSITASSLAIEVSGLTSPDLVCARLTDEAGFQLCQALWHNAAGIPLGFHPIGATAGR